MNTNLRSIFGSALLWTGVLATTGWTAERPAPAAKRTGGLFEALRPKAKAEAAPATDPFTAGRSSAGQPGATAPSNGPITGSAARPQPVGQPIGQSATGTAPAGDPRRESDMLIINARRSLAVGDVNRAKDHLARARSLNVPYQLLEDSPAKVEELLGKVEQLNIRRGQEADNEALRRATALLLLEQSEGLLRWRDLDSAERLARDAERLAVNFNPFETKPADLLGRIAQIRRGDEPQAVNGAGVANELAAAEGQPDAPPASLEEARARVLQLVAAARQAQAAGDWDQTEALARQAMALRVPDSAFAGNEDRPALVLLDVKRARQAAEADNGGRATRASYDAPIGQNTGRTIQDPNVRPATVTAPSEAMGLLLEGEAALTAQDLATAKTRFRQAAAIRGELDAASQKRLDNHLIALAQTPSGGSPALGNAASQLSVEEKKLLTDVADKEREAKSLLVSEPKRSVEMLNEIRAQLEASTVSDDVKRRTETRLNRSMADAEKYIRDNRARIELDDRNKSVLEEIDRQRDNKIAIQEKLARIVEEYNKLMDDRRYPEAELLAKQAMEIAPEEAVSTQLMKECRLIRNFQNAAAIRDQKEQGFVMTLEQVDKSSIPFSDDTKMEFPKDWKDITTRRGKLAGEGRRKSAKEIEIEQKLRTPVDVKYESQPLSTVISSLGTLAGINVHLNQAGLAEEGVSSDTPVTINLSQEISLKSALNLILKPLRLDYVIKDEVLQITSEQLRHGETYPVTYNVADLVIPIPNFVPNNRMGLSGALKDAYNTLGYGGQSSLGATQAPLAVAATRDGGSSSSVNPSVLASLAGTSTGPGTDGPSGGPGGLGGVPQPDFDSLIELITSTIEPQSWDEVGGPGTIEEFRLNLSLVISQTQDVHEQIVDLLQQLRRLQDLQVAIEVRFITLSDNFFERIGISFDFDINSNVDRPFQVFGRYDPNDSTSYTPFPFNTNGGVPRDVIDRDLNRSNSALVGMSLPNVFSADLDIPVRTGGSFTSAVPQFGGFDAATAASTGFAILSDIEAYFFVQAAQGDRRSNVLQAPKVTLFNGQSATISDQSFSPFVISVIPVVGDFAAAQQPVILVLPEGTNLTVQAVVSSDRRFVRLTVVPYFSNIEKVDTFTFTGSRTTSVSSGSEGPDDATSGRNAEASETVAGTTVQLPTLAVVTVTTTVSVPDGGTVLLGGIKRLREGRTEFGVPFLNKIPYVKRLFSNVGIGRETSSLMLMVTPRIIIQEEEEQLLGINPTQP
ncbi:MAG: hypothetical protein AB7O62_20905 [Pirellulales bacterium]